VEPSTEHIPPFRRRMIRIFFLCLAVFLMAAAVALGVFEGMPHLEDEQANYFQARVFAGGEIAAPAPPSRDAFFIPFTIVRDGLWFGKYTPGYPLVLAAGVLLGAPWLVNALASALALAGVFLLGRDLFGADAGLLAAALGAVSPAFIILSGSLLPHPVTMAASVFFAWAFLRARRPGETRAAGFALLAGAALGLAVLSRPWTAFGIALPFIGIALFDLVRTVSGRSALRAFLRAYVPFIIVCLAVCALLPLYNSIVTGSPFTNTYTLWWPFDTVGFGPGTGRAAGGHTPVTALVNAWWDLFAFQTALTGWPAPLGFPLVVLPLIMGLLLAPRSRNDLLLLFPPLALILIYLAYWARAGEFYGGRYYSEGMPFLWLLAARGLLKFSAGKWRLRLVRAVLPIFLVWSILFQIEPRLLRGRGLYGITREYSSAVITAGLHDALVFVHIRRWTDYAAFAWLNDPDLDGDVIFVRDLGGDRNAQMIRVFPGREVFFFDRDANNGRLIPYGVP
jgi:4-amino-4-deoxy-L-arabinose transferase-like glycosyltransferase